MSLASLFNTYYDLDSYSVAIYGEYRVTVSKDGVSATRSAETEYAAALDACDAAGIDVSTPPTLTEAQTSTGVTDAGVTRFVNLAQDQVASPTAAGGVGFRPALDTWFAARDAATAAAPVDVVMLHDSLWDLGDASTPSAVQMLHRLLNAGVGVQGADPVGVSTLPLPVHGHAGAGTGTSTSQGTASVEATGQQGSTLTNGQVLTHIATATGFSVLYRSDPAYGTLTFRDGPGGTVLGTVDCAATAKSGNLWVSGALSDASHTLHVTSTGTTRVEMVMPTRVTRVRTWPAGWAGATTDGYLDSANRGLDLIDTLDAAGSLGLVVICTGTNDDGEPTDVSALVDLVRTHTAADVVLWVPYMSGAFGQTEYDALLPVARAADAVLVDASVVVDQIGTVDGTHPGGAGRAVMAAHLSAVLSGDPIGAAIRLAAAVSAGRGATNARMEETGLNISGDAYMLRTASATLAFGTALSILLGTPDGTLRASALQGTEKASDPAAPAANNGILYFRDNGSGKTQLCARFATGAVQVIATEP